jgi:hypothetical protein
VCILSDSAGSLLAYDTLSRMHSPAFLGQGVGTHYGSHESVDEIDSPMLKPKDLNSHELSRSDPDIQTASTPDPTAERRKRTERSRSEVRLGLRDDQ